MSITGGLLIMIQGVAARVVSAVNDWVFGMKQAGMSYEKIKERLKEEIESGSAVSEARRFAESKVPGYAGELIHRFGRDTLADRQRKIKDILKEAADREQISDKDAKATLETWKKQGIDTTAWKDGQLPDPPPDASLDDRFTWIAIHDKRTCDVCDANHGYTKTLREWAEIGVPRSGACRGEWRCRCLLVPEGTVKPGDVPQGLVIPRE